MTAETAGQQAQAAQRATESVRTIAQEKKAAQALADQKREELQSHLFHENLDRDSRFNRERDRMEADLRESDAGFTQQRQAELVQVTDRLGAEGLQKLARDLAGRTAQDQLEKENLEKTIADAETRAAEERGVLEHQQQAKREADAGAQRDRQAAFDQRLTAEVEVRDQMAREYAQEQAAAQEWAREAPQELQNQEAAAQGWERSVVAEQQNIEPAQTSVEAFNTVAEPIPQYDDTQAASDAFNTAAVPSPVDQSQYQETLDRYSADLEAASVQDQSQTRSQTFDRDQE